MVECEYFQNFPSVLKNLHIGEDGDWSSMLVSTAQDPDLIIIMCVLQDNDLSEFDESREIVQNLVDEYKACESADYIKWGMEVSCACCAFQDFGD